MTKKAQSPASLAATRDAYYMENTLQLEKENPTWPKFGDPAYKWRADDDMCRFVAEKIPDKLKKEKDPKKDRKRYRGFMLTLMNWTEEDLSHVVSLYEENELCKYLMVGFEEAPRTGTPHLQCFIYYTEPISLVQMKKRRHRKYNVKPSGAKNPVNAYAYCSDDWTYHYIELGERPIQGQRTDLNMMMKDATDGNHTVGDIIKRYPEKYGYFFRSIDRARAELLRFPTKVVWFDTNANPVMVMEAIHSIYNHSFDRIFMEHECTNMEMCKILMSKTHRILFIPRDYKALEQTIYRQMSDYVIAEITIKGLFVINEEECENLRIL